MKIRADFVTNSSSVSFILTMHPEMADSMIKYWGTSVGAHKQVAEFLVAQLEKKGHDDTLAGEPVRTMRLKFADDGDQLPFDGVLPELAYAEPLMRALSDDEMWGLVYSYILEGKLNLLPGFGAVQIESY